MTPDPTPQPGHGAAGFCTDHAQAPDERAETVARVLREHWPYWDRCRCGWRTTGDVGRTSVDHRVHLAAAILAALDDETARLRREVEHMYSEREWIALRGRAERAESLGIDLLGRSAEHLADLDAARAALDRVRVVCAQIAAMPIPADPGMSQTAITGRIVATITRSVRAALDPEEPR